MITEHSPSNLAAEASSLRNSNQERYVTNVGDHGSFTPEKRLELTRSALEKLPAELRQVIEMRHRDDFSFADIARSFDESEEAARRMWAEAVRQLQQVLRHSGAWNSPPAATEADRDG